MVSFVFLAFFFASMATLLLSHLFSTLSSASPTQSPNSMYTTTCTNLMVKRLWSRWFIGKQSRSPASTAFTTTTVQRLAQESVAGFASRSALAKLFVWPSSYFYSSLYTPLLRYQEIAQNFFGCSLFCLFCPPWREGIEGGRRLFFSAFLSFNQPAITKF